VCSSDLDLSETWHYTASHTVNQADLDAGGSINNSAHASTAQGASGDGAAAGVPVDQNAHLVLDKSGTFRDDNADTYSQPGEHVDYTFNVTNDGNVTLHNASVTDSLVTAAYASGDGNANSLLDPGEVWTFTGSYAITSTDITAGTVHNDATASALGPQNQAANGADSANTALPGAPPPPPSPSFTVQGTALGYEDLNTNSTVDAGDLIDFAVLITNTGNVSLTTIGVSDLDGIFQFHNSPLASLAVADADGTMTATHTVQAGETSISDNWVGQSDQVGNVLEDVSVDYSTLSALGTGGYIASPDIPAGLAGKGLAHWDVEHGYFA